MADDKNKTGKQDRDHVGGAQDYEVQYLVKEAGVTTEQARQLINSYGNDREKLVRAARSIASKTPRVRSSRV